jgi:hypothetical protein
VESSHFSCCPRFRIEHRHPALATLIVGFGDTPLVVEAQLARVRIRLLGRHVGGELAVVAQDSDDEVLCIPVAWSGRG